MYLIGLNVKIFLEIGQPLRNITTVTWILEFYYLDLKEKILA
jgi:hypothetical protein